MFKKLLLQSLFLSLSYSLLAQNEATPSELKPEPERHKWEVALNVWNVILNPKEGEAGLMLRKHFIGTNERKMAYRFGVHTTNFFKSESGWTQRRPHFNQLGISFGKEWQKQTGKFMVYYGSGISFFGRYDRNGAAGPGTTFPEGKEYAFNRGSNLYLSGTVSGILGAKYLFSDRFSLSVESNLYYQLSEEKHIDKYYDSNNKVVKTTTGNYSTNHIIGLLPISTFYVSYYF